MATDYFLRYEVTKFEVPVMADLGRAREPIFCALNTLYYSLVLQVANIIILQIKTEINYVKK